MEKIIVTTEQAPAAIGPYSQAVRFNNLVFISGQLGIVPSTGELKEGISAQTQQSLDNIGAILASLGLTYEHVVKTTVFVKDLDDFATVNKIYGDVFTENAPARSCVEVSRLPKRALVEIECIAVYPEENAVTVPKKAALTEDKKATASIEDKKATVSTEDKKAEDDKPAASAEDKKTTASTEDKKAEDDKPAASTEDKKTTAE
ncbi:MAG: hypothetical protein IJU23_06515 [Proteobacteria bacterium]|nr:hypothetical protein [Pseudomonadota bacterium]